MYRRKAFLSREKRASGTSEGVYNEDMGKVLPIVLMALLAGCAHVVSKDMREEAADVEARALFGNPEEFIGQTVILGGVIVNTTNFREDTVLEVLQRPLDHRGRPEWTDASRGRFILKADEFLDRAIYARGREVTAAGTVEGVESRPLGETTYRYLVLRSRELHLLKPRSPYPRVHFGLGVFHSF
jgi:outer membrane lipoprotein